MHISDSGRKDIHFGFFYELRRFFGRGQYQFVRGLVVDLRASSNVPDFTFNDNARIDGLQLFNRLSRLSNILLKGQGGTVEYH